MIWLLLELLTIYTCSQRYSIYSFYDAKTYYYAAGSSTTLGLQSISLNSNQTYLAIKGAITRDPVAIYYKESDNYSYRYSLSPPQGSSFSPISFKIVEKNSTVIAIVSYGDNNIRVFSLSSNQATYLQTITAVIGTNIKNYYLQAILLTTNTNTTVLLWNQTTQMYNTAFTISDIAKNQNARGISSDGKYFIQDLGLGTTIIYLYTYNAGTYILTGSYDLSPIATTSIKHVSLYQDSNSSYFSAVGYISGATYIILHFSINLDNFTLIQTSLPIPTFSSSFLTYNGNYLLSYTSSPKGLYYYSYNISTASFRLLFSTKNIISSLYQLGMYSSQDGSFFAVALASLSSVSFSYKAGLIYFTCDVLNCADCSFFDICRTCNSGFILNNTQCSCPNGQANLNGICISCQVNLCQHCSSVDICQSCSKSFVLQGNQCTCPSPKTISLLSGFCVTCSIADCIRCDYDNICSLWSSSLQSSTNSSLGNSNSSNNNDLKQLKSMVIFLIVLMILITLGLIAGLIYLTLRGKSMKVVNHKEQTPNIVKEDKSLNETNFKIVSDSSEVKIQNFIKEEPSEETAVSKFKKKRRFKKQLNIQQHEQIIAVQQKESLQNIFSSQQ